MSYHRKPAALGDVASVITAAGSVASDPYFNEAICRIGQLSAIQRNQPVPACAVTPPNQTGGVGLGAGMPVLRGYVYASKQPYKWPLYAALAGIVGVPILIGYAIGRNK